MNLNSKILDSKDKISEKWISTAIEGYPSRTGTFLKSNTDLFSNPVGVTLKEALPGILENFFQEQPDLNRVQQLLDQVLRVRAVQKFSPSQAIKFVFDLKVIIRETLKLDQQDIELLQAGQLMDQYIDQLAGVAMDKFMECRETLFSIRLNQNNNRFYRAFKKAGLLTEEE